MSNLPEVVQVPVTESMTLQSWRDDDGEIIVGLRWACEQIGVAWNAQYVKLQSNPLFNSNLVRYDIITQGRKREIIGLELDKFLMFLATINAGSVKADAKEPLLLFQRESATALRDYWTRGVAVSPQSGAMTIYDQMRFQLDQLEAHDKRLAEHDQRLKQVEETAKLALSNSEMMTIAEYAYRHKIVRQFPPQLWAEFGKHIAAYCEEHNIDTPPKPVKGRSWSEEKTYPEEAIRQLLPGWLKSQRAQLGMKREE